ncbi:MAG: hypothetical protein ACK5EA_28430, partial [Planctomycetaceae bacterium]
MPHFSKFLLKSAAVTPRLGFPLLCCLWLTIIKCSQAAEPDLEARGSHRARVILDVGHRASEPPVRLGLPPVVLALARA